jgi:hypothetical protein
MTLTIVLSMIIFFVFFYALLVIAVHLHQESGRPPLRQPLGGNSAGAYAVYSGGDGGSCGDGGGGGGGGGGGSDVISGGIRFRLRP